MNKEEYLKHFSDSEEKAGKKHKKALTAALDTRKFEIELYWKRATYFWAFIAVTFAAYGLVQRLDTDDKTFMSFFLSCLGFILSFGWVLANRGSKQWQENWEHHVDHLEDAVIGPLYKITMPRNSPKGIKQWLDFIFVGPSKHSVSKINQLISTYIASMWLILIARSPKSWNIYCWTNIEIAVLFFTILGCLGLLFLARTHGGPYVHKPHLRKSEIVED